MKIAYVTKGYWGENSPGLIFSYYQARGIAENNQKITLIMQTSKKSDDEKNDLIYELIRDDFLNETRFAKSFARGKFKFKNWGRNRITLELKRRKLSNKNIEIGLDEIDEEDYKQEKDRQTLGKKLPEVRKDSVPESLLQRVKTLPEKEDLGIEE